MSGVDQSKITIISAKKVDTKKFAETGSAAAVDPDATKIVDPNAKKCTLCCMGMGVFFSFFPTAVVSSVATYVNVRKEKRVNYNFNALARQAMWQVLPGVLISATLHMYLSEAMWSQKRNTAPMAWNKAFLMNNLTWLTLIGGGTLFWRKGLRKLPGGKRLYNRWLLPADHVFFVVMRDRDAWLRGMGWQYWLSGVASGQVGFAFAVAGVVSQDRMHMLMAPNGYYARGCMPGWRRKALMEHAMV